MLCTEDRVANQTHKKILPKRIYIPVRANDKIPSNYIRKTVIIKGYGKRYCSISQTLGKCTRMTRNDSRS